MIKYVLNSADVSHIAGISVDKKRKSVTVNFAEEEDIENLILKIAKLLSEDEEEKELQYKWWKNTGTPYCTTSDYVTSVTKKVNF